MASAVHYESNIGAEGDIIPVWDLSGSDQCQKCLKDVSELGFFRIINHGITRDLLNNVDMVCRDMFKLPTETKKKNMSSHGYIGGNPEIPYHESLGIVFPGLHDAQSQALETFCHQLWHEGNPNFYVVMEEYICAMRELEKRIVKEFLACWGVSKYYDSGFGHGRAILRMHMYEVASELASETVGLLSHTDKDFITILHEDESGGLQVENKEGVWLDVTPIPESLVVFLGEAFQAWSNGMICSSKHRVMLKGRQNRLSLSWFSMPPEEMEVKAPPELVDEQHPQLYRPFPFGELYKFWVREGKKHERPLEPFAGLSL